MRPHGRFDLRRRGRGAGRAREGAVELAGGWAVGNVRAWLFRIAHNCAIDHLRRKARDRAFGADNEVPDEMPSEDKTDRTIAGRAGFEAFVGLSPVERACVILSDVLEHPAEDICDLLEVTLAAEKAALHRGRAKLRSRSRRSATEPPPFRRQKSGRSATYAALFNARDFDAIRRMLADDVGARAGGAAPGARQG